MDNEKLKKFIADSGFKRSHLADKLGISSASLWNKLNGKTDFTVTESMALKELLGMTESEYMSLFFDSCVPQKKQGG